MSLNPKQLKFVDAFVHQRGNHKTAAVSAGYQEGYGKALSMLPEVRTEIDRRTAIVDLEKAKITAKTHILDKDLLDGELVNVIKSETSPTKLNAIEMGYKRIGMIAGGEFIPDPDAQKATPTEQIPRIFRASQRELLVHTTETKETVERVVERTIESAAPEQACPFDF